MEATRKIPRPPPWRWSQWEILAEVPDDPLGLVLWKYVRHVRDWATASEPKRAALFRHPAPEWVEAKVREAAQQAADLRFSLAVLGELISRPGAVQAEELSRACYEVAQWAEKRAFVWTAIQYAEAAALTSGEAAPIRARLAARLTREAGETVRSELWFRRAIPLALKTKNWPEYIRAHLGYGTLCMRMGRDQRAQEHFTRAANRALRTGYQVVAAEAQHDLLIFMSLRGNFAEAEAHAWRAFQLYPKNSRRFPFLVADVALLLNLRRQFALALQLLTPFLETITDPAESILGLSSYARALAGSGDRKGFAAVRRLLLEWLAAHAREEASARWNLGEGERSLGLWRSAERNARRAIEAAEAAGDAETARLARNLAAAVERRIPAPPAMQRVEPATADLLASLGERLAQWAPTRRGRPPTFRREDWVA